MGSPGGSPWRSVTSSRQGQENICPSDISGLKYVQEREEAEPRAVFWYRETIKYSHARAKDGWCFSSCSRSGLVWSDRRGKEWMGFTPMVGATAQCGTRTSFSSPLSHVDAHILQHRVSPSTHRPCRGDSPALLAGSCAVPEGEGGRNPILGSKGVPHGAGAQQGTEGWTGQSCTQWSKAGHGGGVTETVTLALPNGPVLVHSGDTAVGSVHSDGLEYLLAEERGGELKNRRLWGNLLTGMHA